MEKKYAAAINKPCRFAQWKFDPTDGQLHSKHKEHRLQPRLSKLLSIFLANSHTLLTREALIEMLWQDKAVNEDALSRCIAELRATLGDNSTAPIFIETVPKKGYRFVQSIKVTPGKKVLVVSTVLILILSISITINYFKVPVNKADAIKAALISASRITTDTDMEYRPVLSAKGNHVAYAVIEDKRLIIKIIKTSGGLLYKIKDPELHFYSPAFAPDGKSILMAGYKKDQCSTYRYYLPSLKRDIVGNCQINSQSGIYDWSEDGKQIAYIAAGRNSTNSSVWIYDIESQRHQQLTEPVSNKVFDSNPKFSSNAKRLAFSRGTKSSRELFYLDIDNPENPNQLTTSRNFISSFDWLNDDVHIVFDSDEMGDRNLWLLNINNQQKQLLGARDAQFPSFNSNNSFLTFQDIRYNTNIWNVNLNDQDEAPSRIIKSIKYNNNPVFSPDDKHIVFTSNRGGKGGIWLYSQETKEQKKLLLIPELNLFMSNWSSDGKKLLVSTRSKDGYRCLELTIKTGIYQPLSEIKQEHYSCIYANNGEIFAVTKTPEKSSKLLKLTTDGEVVMLGLDNINRIEADANGSIIYSVTDQNGLYSIDYNGTNNKILLPNFYYNHDNNWTVRGNYLYFPRLNEQKGIWRYHLLTAEESFVTPHLPSTIGLTMNVSHDHSQLLISRTESRQSNIYLAKIATDN